ncbi:reverse transcriptase [Senna tora]|uniref:Reverse transcriptase n=1 Tax=Senna tora TaxID=362788 RepID=A0A834TXX9_9FABA|nr:reverse transcriptase [Senna tora]
MNFVIWNSRGTGSRTFPGLVRDIKHRHNVDFLALIETRQSGEKANEIIKKLGFDGVECVEASGFSGGIWCLWRKERIMVSVLGKHRQFIHLRINRGVQEWLFTVVYGSLAFNSRRQLWESLTTIGANVDLPWAVAGDFNAFLFDYEKHGGRSGGSRPDQGFRDWVDNCAMMDMGFTGSRYTWRRSEVSIRLDRIMVSQNWKLMFPEAAVVHLPCFKSDHNPLWLRFYPSVNSQYRHDRPFRFLAAWVTHESFLNVVLWNGDKTNGFRPSRGIRQGDPISPYIFVLCMERLAHLIQEKVSRGRWKPIGLGRTGPKVSHLFFADDLILFAEASMNQVEVVKDCINNFCISSGQKVNADKTRVFFSRNVSFLGGGTLSNALGFTSTNDLGKYLGVPLIHGLLRHKYGCGDDVLPRVSAGSNPSRLWQGIVKNWGHIENGIQWRIGNGNRIKFWSDGWIPKCDKLCNLALGPIPEIELTASVSSFTTPSGGWDWQRFDYMLPDNVCLRIASIVPPSSSMGEDTPIWRHSRDGKFSVESCYNAVNGVIYGSRGNVWNSIWKLNVPQRVRSSMWLCANNKLLTNVERCKRQISDSSVCDCCGGASEDVIHALRDCDKVRDIWLRLVKPRHWPEFFHSELRDWISMNLNRNLGVFDNSWKDVFATTCWSVWRWRNEQLFQHKDGIPSDPRPESIWVKVNVDGAVSRDSSERASCGGVVRNHEGHFVLGFNKSLGSCDVLTAELWGVRLGLEMAWELGLRKVVIELDSLCAHQLIHAQVQELHPCATLVTAIHQLMTRNWDVHIHHVLRDANQVADFFAGCASHATLNLMKFDHPPTDAVHLLNADAEGTGSLRFISA